MKPVVYLAGPITGLKGSEAKDWRIKAKEALKNSFRVLDPLRGKGIEDSKTICNYTMKGPRTVRAIFHRDYYDVKRADVILVNLNGPKSLGTMAEMAWAFAWQKPIIAVFDLRFFDDWDVAFVQAMMSLRADSLDEALEMVESFK